WTILTIAILLMIGASGAARAQRGSNACDRACLEGLVDQYLNAIVAHDPKMLPFANNVKFTENGVRLEVGDAHWKTTTAKGSYRLFVTDPEAGQVAFIGTIREEGGGQNGTSSALALRLKVANRQITEIETLVIRSTTQAGGGARGAGGRGGADAAATGAGP